MIAFCLDRFIEIMTSRISLSPKINRNEDEYPVEEGGKIETLVVPFHTMNYDPRRRYSSDTDAFAVRRDKRR